jgi:hypothetical protein
VLHKQGAAIDHIYFPLSGMVSLLAIMQTGEAIETGIIGAEGVLGGDAPIRRRPSTNVREIASTPMYSGIWFITPWALFSNTHWDAACRNRLFLDKQPEYTKSAMTPIMKLYWRRFNSLAMSHQ